MNCYNLCAASEAIENASRYKWMGRVENRMALSGKDVAIASDKWLYHILQHI